MMTKQFLGCAHMPAMQGSLLYLLVVVCGGRAIWVHRAFSTLYLHSKLVWRFRSEAQNIVFLYPFRWLVLSPYKLYVFVKVEQYCVSCSNTPSMSVKNELNVQFWGWNNFVNVIFLDMM